MKAPARIYELLGALVTYPGPNYLTAVRACLDAAEELPLDMAAKLASFLDRLAPLSTNELQELYTVTFDLNPVCSLEVGWHLYGDSYDRGEFLVKMRQILRRTAVPETTELPDHLSHVLAALPRLDAEEASTLVATAVLPALEKMLSAFAGKHNPFEQLLTATFCLLNDEVWPTKPAASATA